MTVSEVELEVQHDAEHYIVQFTLTKGRSRTVWELRESDSSSEILESLREVLEATGGSVGAAEAKPYAPPSAIFTPPVPAPQEARPSGVSWNDESAIDDLPIM